MKKLETDCQLSKEMSVVYGFSEATEFTVLMKVNNFKTIYG